MEIRLSNKELCEAVMFWLTSQKHPQATYVNPDQYTLKVDPSYHNTTVFISKKRKPKLKGN